jgi:tetratricopeptide (TPR) repeat protein
VQQQKMKHDECGRRLEAAVARFPSADLLADLAGAQLFEGRLEDGIATCAKTLELDPSYARVAALMGQMQAYTGRLEEGLATLVECTRRLPGATSCIDYRIWLHTKKGECAAVENDARDWMAAAPLDGGRWGPQHYLADAQISLGKPIEAVRETLHQKWAKTSNAARDTDEALDLASLAILTGDFAAAEKQIGEIDRLSTNDPTLDAHALPAMLRVALYDEEGRLAEAAQVAEAFMNRRESFIADTRDDDWTIAKDPSMRMFNALYRSGRITRDAYVAKRTQWLGQWSNAPLRGYEFFPAYVDWIKTREEAEEAFAAVPAKGIAPFRPFIYPEAQIGHAYALVDRIDDAMPYLEQANRACYALEEPFTFVHARMYLGEALEKKGDRDGACAAFGEVISRWGGAKSLTAADAKKHATALKCAK